MDEFGVFALEETVFDYIDRLTDFSWDVDLLCFVMREVVESDLEWFKFLFEMCDGMHIIYVHETH